ncbi:hypothetical protein KC352_g18490, partial [Hortaea werneckii]
MEDPQPEPVVPPTMKETTTKAEKIASLQGQEESPSDKGLPLSVQGESMMMDTQQQQREGSNEESSSFAEGFGMVKGILGGKRKEDAVVSPSGVEDKEGARVKRVRFVDSEEGGEGEGDGVVATIEDTGSMELGVSVPGDLAEVVDEGSQRDVLPRQDTPGPDSRTLSGLQEDLDDLTKDMDEVQKDRTHWRIKATELSVKLGELRKWKQAKEREEMEQRAVATQKIEAAVKSGTVRRIQEMREKNEETITTLEQKHKAKLDVVNAKHAEQMLAKEEKWKKLKEDLTAKHEALKEDLHERHEGNKKRLKQRLDKNRDELAEAKESFAEEKKKLRLEQQEAIKAAKPETNAAIKSKDVLLKQKNETINQLQHELSDLQTQITSLENHTTLLQEANSTLSTQLSASQTQIHTHQETLRNQTQRSEAQVEALEREKLHIEEALATAQAEFVETLDHERRSARIQYEAAQGAKAAEMEARRAVFALRTALEGKEGRLEGLRRE